VKQHHIIDPSTQKSAKTEFLSVTVIADTTVSADVFAKTLFIAGKERGQTIAEQHHLPAIFIEHTGAVHINQYAKPYVWKEDK
jgi:thiamine biosynthesis lipoprotein